MQTTLTGPTPPTDLRVKISDDAIILNWEFSPLANSYTIKRAETSGGTYTVIATDINVPEYFDNHAAAGKTYYYVVGAVNDLGESPDSIEASAAP
jgi:fibronectin type 3 domain-containing protein